MMNRRTKQEIAEERQKAIAAAQAEFFGDVSKEEAIEVFRVLTLLAQFPGAEPPAPLQGCQVVWTSTLKVGDSLAQQSFDVQTNYRGLRFFYTGGQNRTIQLPDTSFMSLESWDYYALHIAQKFSK
jgi:hypothetical protein